MTHNFSVKNNGGVKVGLRDRNEIIKLTGATTLTRDWDLNTNGITPYETYCTIYCYAIFKLNGHKLKYFGYEVDDKYALKPHKVVAVNVRDKWKIEVSLISLVGGPATTPPGSAKDEKVKVASGDPTAGYLIQKIKHGPEILLSTSILDPDSWALKILNAGPFTRNLIDGRIEQRFPGYPLYFKTGESILFQASSQAITNFQNVASTVNWKGDHTVISAFAIHEYLNSDTYMHHWHKEADIKDLDRMRWAHPWHLKTMVNPYVKNDVVTEGDWLMIANKPTIDHAAPQEIGSPIYAATDAPAFLLEHHTAVVRSGQHYGFKKVGQIKEIRAWVPEIHANIHHKFIVIDDSDPTNPEIVGTVISKADEWEIIIDYNKTIAVGDKLLIIVETTYDHQPTKFSQQKTYWPTNHVGFADIHGHLEFDGHPQPGQEVTDSLFGIDIQFQELSISPDWDVLASSSGGTSSGGGGTPTVVSHPAVIDRDVPNSHPSLAIDHHFPRTTNLPGDLDYLKNLIDNKVTVVSPAVANNIVTLEAGGTLQDSGYSFDTGLAGTVTYWKTYKQLSHEPIMKFKAGYGGVTQVIIGNANNETLPPYSDKQALWIAQNSAFVAGLAMKNWNTGPRASFRFSLFDTAGGYLAFDMPSVNNTSMIFGHRRSTLTWMATIGKSHLRHLAIGTQETSSLIFGTHNLERMTIDKDGKVKINHFETTQGNFVQEVSGILSKRTTAQVKVQLGIVSSIELWKRTSTLLEPKNSGDGVKGGRWILNGNNISIGSTIAFIYSDHTAPFSISTMAGQFLFISLPNAAIDAAPDSSAVTKGWVQSKITPSLWARTGTILSPSTVGDNVKVRNWLIDELSIKFSNLSVLEVNSVSNWLSIGTGSFHGLAILGHDIQFNDLSIANINSGGGKFAVTKEWVLSKIPTVQPYQTLRWVRTTKTLSISHGNSVTLIHNHTWAEVLGKPDVVYTLSGDVTGHITAAVGAAVSIVTTVKNDSHTHAGYMLRSHSAKTDPNTVKVSSGYRFEKHANNPDPVGFYSIVTFGNETNVIGQHAIHFTTGASYTRSFNTAWSPWLRQWSSADFTSTDVTNWNAAHVHSLVVTGNPHHVTWAELLSKPAKFPPSAHTHTHASTTGQTANDHHNQVHELVSSDHTVAGLTAGYVLTALSATTFGFKAITQATAQTLTWVPTTKTLSISHGNSVILNHTHPWSEIIDHPEVLWTKEADRLFPATLSNKVGIGTQNPGAKLEVKDNGTKVAFGTHAHAISDPCIMTSDNRGNLDRIFQRQTSTGSVFVGDIDNNNGSVFVRAAGATYLTIHSSGKIGVGSITTPLHTLDVAGDARISRIIKAPASYTGFLLTAAGIIKYRTLAEIKSDLGIVASTPQTLSWVPTTKLLTISQGNHVTLNHTHHWSEITDHPASIWVRDTHGIYPKTLTDKVGIGTATPSHTLDITGDLGLTANLSFKTDFNGVSVIDTRANDYGPTKFTRIIRWDFKARASCGNPLGTGVYVALQTLASYSDDTGGPQHQMAFGYENSTSNPIINIRTGLKAGDSWKPWLTIADRAWVTAQITAGGHSPWTRDTHGIYPKTLTDKVGIGIAIPTEALEVAGKVKIKENTLSAESVTFESATNKGLYLRNANGYISLTPFNTGWAHIYTDRSNFIFNKRLIVQGSVPHLSSYHASDLFIAAGNATTAAHAGIKIGHVDQAVTLRNSLTIVRITPSHVKATTYLTALAGLVMSRTGAEVLADIGASPAVHSHHYLSTVYLTGRHITDADKADVSGVTVYYLPSTGLHRPTGVNDGALLTLSYSNVWSAQMFSDWRTNKWFGRNQNNGTWGAWKAFLMEGDVTANDGKLTMTATGSVHGSATFTANQAGASTFAVIHLTTAGHKHIPTAGIANQYLKWSALGTAVWATIPHGVVYNLLTQNNSTRAAYPIPSSGTGNDLNVYLKSGYFHQPGNAGAGAGKNYPLPALAGLLDSRQGVGSISLGQTFQTYHTYDNTGWYFRSKYQTTWYPWKQVADRAWVTAQLNTKGTVTSIATSGAILGGPITTTGTITHSKVAGYKHIPSGGALNQFLKWSASGTVVWASLPATVHSSKWNEISHVLSPKTITNKVAIGSSTASYNLDVTGNARVTKTLLATVGRHEHSVGQLIFPKGGVYGHSASSVKGRIVITLPHTGSNTMMGFWVDVFDYGTKAFSAFINFYNYATGPTVILKGSFILSGNDVHTQYVIRAGLLNGKAAVTIGEITSPWAYPKVFVRTVHTGQSHPEPSYWESDWVVSIQATTTGFVERSKLATNYPWSDYNKMINKPVAIKPIWKSTAHIVQLASLTDTEVNLLAAQSLSFGPSSMGNKIHYGTTNNLTIVDGRMWRFTGTLDLSSFQFTNKAGTVNSFGTVANGLVDWTSEAQVVSAKAIAAKISSGGGTTPNDGTLSMRGSGILSGSATFSADQAGNSSFTVTHNIGSGFYHVPAGGSRGQILGWHSLGQAGWIAMPAPALPGNGLLTMSATGALSGSATFHANQSTNTTFRVVHNTSSGYKHIPAGGRHGYTLVWASSGTAKWEPPSLDAGYSYWTVRVGSGHGNILNHDTILFSGGTGVDIRASLSRNPRTISFSLKDVNLIINTDRFDTPTAAITAHFTPGATIYLKGAVTSPTGHVVRTGVHSSNTIYFYIQAHSDRRLKKNITVTDPSLAYKLKPSRFTWKDSGLINFGFIAQEVEDAIPEIAFRDKDGTMSYNMPSIPAINNAAIQALKKEIEELKKKLNILLSKS